MPTPAGRGRGCPAKPNGKWPPGASPRSGEPGSVAPPLPQAFAALWQWTAAPYRPYPGFAAAPGAVGEYNGKFMTSQFVLRGSCFLTPRGPRPAHLPELLPAGQPLDGRRPAAGAAMLIDLHPEPADMERLVIEGMEQRPRQLPAWLLYDAEGSRLFEAICEQPEYSLTRTETALLEREACSIADALGRDGPGDWVVVEFGAGNARKVGPLLSALGPSAYAALDISADHLAPACRSLQERHQEVPVLGICCDYSQMRRLPPHPLLEGRRLGFYPGSSLGNFEPDAARRLLGQFAQLLGPGSLLLVGMDQPKRVERLEAAYNDAAGFSAAFALNLLSAAQPGSGGGFPAC